MNIEYSYQWYTGKETRCCQWLKTNTYTSENRHFYVLPSLEKTTFRTFGELNFETQFRRKPSATVSKLKCSNNNNAT